MPTEKQKQTIKELQKSNSGQIAATEEKPFKPNRKQLKWLETTLELGYDASLTEISEKGKLRRQSWYDWLQDDNFVRWWDEQMQKILHQNRWKLDAIGLKQAKNKYNYWKDMMNRVGNTIPEPMSIGAQINTQLNIQDDYFRRITKRG